jgi:hypothetical protein
MTIASKLPRSRIDRSQLLLSRKWIEIQLLPSGNYAPNPMLPSIVPIDPNSFIYIVHHYIDRAIAPLDESIHREVQRSSCSVPLSLSD